MNSTPYLTLLVTLFYSTKGEKSSSDLVKLVLGENMIKWTPQSKFYYRDRRFIPAGMKWNGHKYVNTYVARANGMNEPILRDWHPSVISKKQTFVEVLSIPKGTTSWTSVEQPSDLPHNEEMMVFAGKFPVSGEKSYICRVIDQQELVIGKFLPSEGSCLVNNRGSERQSEIFELLVRNLLYNVTGTNQI